MGYGRFEFLHVLGAVVWGVASLAALAVILVVIALLVRFLLVATTAAKIYVEKNRAAEPSVVESSEGATPAHGDPYSDAPTTTLPAPETKPRKPKTPPAV